MTELKEGITAVVILEECASMIFGDLMLHFSFEECYASFLNIFLVFAKVCKLVVELFEVLCYIYLVLSVLCVCKNSSKLSTKILDISLK